MKKLSGILLHPTSLPGKFGIGELGGEARNFIDYLVLSGQGLWQVLPLGPTGYGESPYSSYSAFAGNPLMICLEALQDEGWLTGRDLECYPNFPVYQVDFDRVRGWKQPLLKKAAKSFIRKAKGDVQTGYQNFCKEEFFWLPDYALFMAVKEHYDGLKSTQKAASSSWNECWEVGIRQRKVDAVHKWQTKLASRIEEIKVEQYFFFTQWKALKNYANSKKVKIIGDIPIFVAPDSADLWSHRKLFLVDKDCKLEKVAGVPPDYFSPTGQRWGNPLYNWKAMKADGYHWWIQRIRALLDLVDIVRIDHFRGFEAYWEIPANEQTAVNGKWVAGPREDFFTELKRAIGSLPVIAEDLGFITPEVHKLRKKFKFPGMKILQFAFEENASGVLNAENGYLPHNYEPNSVVYTGTHDNDTTLGWYYSLSDSLKDKVRCYLGCDGHDIVWNLIRAALISPSQYALFPLQDILVYGSDTRMNQPSTVGGTNWRWRVESKALEMTLAGRMKQLCELYNRLPKV